MSQKPWIDKERQAFYDDAIRQAAHQYLAMVQIDVDRNTRLAGCMVGLIGSDLRRAFEFKQVCVAIIRHCDTEITGNLLPIYATAGRLYQRYLKEGNNARIDTLKRQMQYFGHTLALFLSLQESAYVVIDTFHDQYDALVTRSLAPALSDEERALHSQGPTWIPVDEDRLKKLKKKRRAAKDRAERDETPKKLKSKDALEAAFRASLQDDLGVTAAEEDALFKEAANLKEAADRKKKPTKVTKKKSKKKKAESGE